MDLNYRIVIKKSIVLPDELVGVDICWVKLKVFNTLINLESWKSSGSLKCKLKSPIIKKGMDKEKTYSIKL